MANRYAVASWFVTVIRVHMHAGSSPARGTMRTGHIISLCSLSFFVLHIDTFEWGSRADAPALFFTLRGQMSSC